MSHNTEDEENAVSMVDVLEEEKQLEADANAVLAGSDAKNCTYPLGYIPRQAVYACASCVLPMMEPAGVCLACSLTCHDGHELYELYTKRNFRCDCGNSKFPDTPCKLSADKGATNANNSYNQNFRGLYCTCSRPYPDPEDDVEDEMIQCVICEDWFHGRHVGTSPPHNFEEMVCKDCMKHCEFLWAYAVVLPDTKSDPLSDTPNCSFVDVESCTPVKNNGPAIISNGKEVADASNSAETECESCVEAAECSDDKGSNKDSTSSALVEESPVKQNGSNASEGSCLLKELQTRSVTYRDCGVYWSDGWRSKLCTCNTCKQMYAEKKVDFLPDESDSVQSYEAKGRETTSSQYDQGMQALASMNRLQQVEVLQEYNELRTELTDYLKKFAENKKVVREEDIKEFFGQLQSRKRQKTNQPSMSYYCK